MTTVVVDVVNKTMAADTQGTDISGYKYRMFPKIQVFKKDGEIALVGISGSLKQAVLFFDWFGSHGFSRKVTEKQKREYPGLEAMALFSNGDLYEYDASNIPMQVGAVAFHGIGSGSTYALGALYSGKTAEEAVGIAALLDANTGFGVQVETL